MSGEIQDRVVQEIDVFLAKNSEDELFICQYPTRSSKRSFDNDKVVDVKVKPAQKKMEITIALDTNRPSYDRERGNQFAINEKGASDDSHFKNEFMDRQIFHTTQTKDTSKNLFVGYLRNGQLHLSPTSAVLQLHSSFAYMDIDGDKNATNNLVNEEEQEAKPVTVKFARAESDYARKAREKSYSFFLNKSNQEAWLPVEYSSFDPNYAEKNLSSLIGRSNSYVANSSSCDEYSKTILLKSSVKELVRTKENTLIKQMQALMINVKISHFSDLMRFLGNNVDEIAVFRALQNVAVLINGCWIVKSEFLFTKNTASALTGISSDLLCKVRELVLWKFTESTYVTRDSIITLVKIPDEDLKQMLKDIAVYERCKGWKLSISADELFGKRFPEVTQRQKLLWDAKFKSLSKDFELNPKVSGEGSDITLQSPLKKRLNYSIKNESEAPMNTKKFAGSVTIKTETDTSDPAIDSPTNNFNSELASFVKTLLCSYKVITVSELRRHLNQKLSQSAPGHILSSGVSDSVLEVTLKNLGAMGLSSGWTQTTNEIIYALVRVGDETENMRKCFLELFRETSKLRKAAIKKGFQKVAGIPLTDDDLNFLTKDYCSPPVKGCYNIKFSSC